MGIRRISDIAKKLNYILTKQQKMYGILVVLLSFVSAGFELLGVSIIVPLVDALLDPSKLIETRYLGDIFRLLGISESEDIFIVVILGVIGVYVLKNIFFGFNTWVRLKYSCKIQRECSIRMFGSYMRRGYVFFLDHNVNEMLQGAVGDISGLYAMISSILQIITQFTIILLIVAYMLYSDWQLAFGIIVAATLCLIIVTLLFKNKMKEAGIELRYYAIYVNKVLLEAFSGIKEVLVMRRQSYYIKEYEDAIKKKQKPQIIQGIGAEVPAYLIEAICIMGIMGILCVRILNVNDREGFVATLAAFAVGAFRILPGLGKISTGINNVVSYIPNIDAIYENIQSTSHQEQETIKQARNENTGECEKFEKISIQDLSFGYDLENIGFVIDGVDLEIKRGESVALIGETGAGKSTMADIILGLLEPNKGVVEINGKNLRGVSQMWSEMMAFVPQSIYLADNTIKANVAFGVPKNDIDENRVIDALRDANILEFVKSLPQGINTEIGDRGVRMSGGQCQRIGIARALYKAPQVLILDEATSALDNETERVIMETIDSLRGRMTMIIIAHRLSTIRNCDRIYEIVGGKVIERDYQEIV